MTHILAVACQKGGVGKTTTAVNLAAAWADQGARVLLVDVDAQASATQALGFDVSGPYPHLGDMLHGFLANERTGPMRVVMGNLDLIPGHIHLAALENELTLTRRGRETVLRRMLSQCLASYDVVVLDCPPALGWLTVNALTAATDVLIPVKPDYLSMAGLSDLWDTLGWVRTDHNPDLQIVGVLPTMRDLRIGHQGQQLANLLSWASSDEVRVPMLNPIPTSAKAGEAAGEGVPLVRYKDGNGAAKEYKALAAHLWEVWNAAE